MGLEEATYVNFRHDLLSSNLLILQMTLMAILQERRKVLDWFYNEGCINDIVRTCCPQLNFGPQYQIEDELISNCVKIGKVTSKQSTTFEKSFII